MKDIFMDRRTYRPTLFIEKLYYQYFYSGADKNGRWPVDDGKVTLTNVKRLKVLKKILYVLVTDRASTFLVIESLIHNVVSYHVNTC